MPRAVKLNLPEVPKFKMIAAPPKMIGSVADLYYQTRERRLQLDKVVTELKKQESLLKNHIIDTVPKSDATGVAGQIARAQIVMKSVWQPEDWGGIYAYLLKNKCPEILQRRLSTEAVDERMASKKPIPGVKNFELKDVSITKL